MDSNRNVYVVYEISYVLGIPVGGYVHSIHCGQDSMLQTVERISIGAKQCNYSLDKTKVYVNYVEYVFKRCMGIISTVVFVKNMPITRATDGDSHEK